MCVLVIRTELQNVWSNWNKPSRYQNTLIPEKNVLWYNVLMFSIKISPHIIPGTRIHVLTFLNRLTKFVFFNLYVKVSIKVDISSLYVSHVSFG